MTSRNMKGKYGKIRHSSWNFIQDIMIFVINYFFSFPETVKKALQSVLYSRKDPRPAFDSFPLNIVNTKYSHAFDLDQDPSSKSYDDRLQTDEPKETKTDSTTFVYTPIPCKIPYRYKPLVLPSILHYFPTNYYKYLPKFDGEYGSITAKKNIHGFEHFLDLFEVEEDDVCI